MKDKKIDTLTNQAVSFLMQQNQIATNNTWWSSNLFQNYVIKLEEPNKNDKNKHHPQAKLPALNWHNQNPNITTLQMLMMLLQWLCGEVW